MLIPWIKLSICKVTESLLKCQFRITFRWKLKKKKNQLTLDFHWRFIGIVRNWYIVMHYSSICLIKNTVASVPWNTVPCVPFGLEHRRSVFDCSMLCGTVFHPCSTVPCLCFCTQFYGIWNEWLNPVPCLEIQWSGVPAENTKKGVYMGVKNRGSYLQFLQIRSYRIKK